LQPAAVLSAGEGDAGADEGRDVLLHAFWQAVDTSGSLQLGCSISSAGYFVQLPLVPEGSGADRNSS